MKRGYMFIILAAVLTIPIIFIGAKKEEVKARTVKIGEYELKVPDKDPSELEIALVDMNVVNPFHAKLKAGVDAAAEELGVNAYITGATGWDIDAQINIIENMITKGVDGLSVVVIDIPALTPLIQRALDAGIPTTCFNVDAPDSGRLSFVGEDLYLAGAETAEALVEHMGEEGDVFISSVALMAIWSIKREDGVMSVLNNYPNINIVERLNCPGDEQTAYATLENALLAHPEIDGHISLGATHYLWSRLLKNKNIGNIDSANPIYSTGHDLYEEKLHQIEEGWSTVTFGQNPYEQGYQGVKQLYEFLTTGDPSVFKEIDTGVFPVDRSNVQEILDRLYNGEPIG